VFFSEHSVCKSLTVSVHIINEAMHMLSVNSED